MLKTIESKIKQLILNTLFGKPRQGVFISNTPMKFRTTSPDSALDFNTTMNYIFNQARK